MHIDYEIGFRELIDRIEEFWFTQAQLIISFSSLNAFYSEPLIKIATDEDRGVILLNERLLLTTPSSGHVAIVVEAESHMLFQFAVFDLEKNPSGAWKEDYEALPDYRITIAREE
jgi:hypothetical protein